jgi:NADPH:quinone reductase-like Zn-dependent oxidoreductase
MKIFFAGATGAVGLLATRLLRRQGRRVDGLGVDVKPSRCRGSSATP